MVDWTCTKCGHKPELYHRGAYDGWVRIEIAVATNDVVSRMGLFTLCSIDCVLATLHELEIQARMADAANQVDGLDELREKVDALEPTGTLVPQEDGSFIARGKDELGLDFKAVLRRVEDEEAD